MSNLNVSQILNQVHEEMKKRYIVTEEDKQAKVLQNFLQELKIRAFNRKDSNNARNISENIYDIILDSIKLPGKRTLHNLFRRTGKSYQQGYYFEDDLAAVIQAVLNLANPNTKTSIKDIKLGSQVGTTLGVIADDYEKFLEKEIPLGLCQEIENNKPKLTFGKIDTYVKGTIVNLNGKIIFPPGVLEALSNATFTDKSYKSVSWRKGQKIELGDRTIHLGNSDPYRAVLGVMSSLNFSKADMEYIYYAGRNIDIGKDSNPPVEDSNHIKTHIWHMRYIYELTGAGIIYKDFGSQFVGGAKFLVYNDPSSNDIFVISTKRVILDQILNMENSNISNPYSSIGISSAYIKAAASKNN